MSRLLRIQFPGAIYHVTFRGNERRAVFRTDADRLRLLAQMAATRELTQVRVYLVCLMTNHVHLLLETARGNLSEFMGRLLTAYAVYHNRRHRRVGHLTQGRYGAELVEGNEYLLKLSRYIHLNPVCGRRWEGVEVAERRQALGEYRWSTYRSYAGMEKTWAWIDYAPIWTQVGGEEKSATAAYRVFVETGLAANDTEFGRLYREARLSVGSEAFRENVMQLHADLVRRARRREDASLRRLQPQRSAEEVLEVVAAVLGTWPAALKERRRDSLLRAVSAWALSRHGGMNQRVIASVLGMGSGAAVSMQMAKWRRVTTKTPRCRDIAAEIDRRLAKSS